MYIKIYVYTCIYIYLFMGAQGSHPTPREHAHQGDHPHSLISFKCIQPVGIIANLLQTIEIQLMFIVNPLNSIAILLQFIQKYWTFIEHKLMSRKNHWKSFKSIQVN